MLKVFAVFVGIQFPSLKSLILQISIGNEYI